MIEVSKLTLTYPSGKGVFDLDFKISEGKVTGYLGPNGAGKTTTIRAIMGFMAPNRGFCKVNGLDSVTQAPEIQRILGYVPGEIAFLDGMKGHDFLKFLSRMRGTNNKKYVDELFDRFDVDPTGKIKKLSKGNKQKLAIIAAFMHDPKVLVLDEPTSGLDPLMQKRFVGLVKDEKKKGKTILMSSHIFEEVEKTCEDVIIIRDGRIVHASDVASLSKTSVMRYHVGVTDVDAARGILSTDYAVTSAGDALEVMVPKERIDAFVKTLSVMEVLQLESKAQTLEDLFMQYYNKEVAQ